MEVYLNIKYNDNECIFKLYAMSDREPTRWQHNRIYPQPISPCE